MHDNPYQPPHALPQADRDPEIVLRPREYLTGVSFVLMGWKPLVLMVICDVIAFTLVFHHRPLTGLAVALALLAIIPAITSGPPAGRISARILQERHGLSSPIGSFVADLTFDTRISSLKKTLCERTDTTDDIGTLHCDGETLHFYGDCSTITLSAADIAQIAPHGCRGLFTRRTRVDLARPISGQTSFVLCIREGTVPWAVWARAREMQARLIAWHEEKDHA
jgi:hypothetical protein